MTKLGKKIVLFQVLSMAFLSSTCFAQISAPQFKMLNNDGVNLLTSSNINIQYPTLEIKDDILSFSGINGNNLTYSRYYPKIGPWFNNMYGVASIDIPNVYVQIGESSYIFSSIYPMQTINGVTSFGDANGNSIRMDINAAGLVTIRLITKDGVAYIFDNHYNNLVYLGKIEYPSGMYRKYYYKTFSSGSPYGPEVRLQSVVQSDGLQLKLLYRSNTYQSNSADWRFVTSATIFNQSHFYCDPAADQCASGLESWPTASFSGPSTGFAPIGQVAIDKTITSSGAGRSYKRDSYGRIIGVSKTDPYAESLTFFYVGNSYAVMKTKSDSGIENTYTSTRISYTGPFGPLNRYIVKENSSYDGSSNYYYFDEGKGDMPYEIKDELGRSTKLEMRLNDNHYTKITFPEGNYDTYSYDPRFNITSKYSYPKPGSNLNPRTETQGFASSCVNINNCNKPSFYIDANGRKYDFLYTDFGEKSSEMGPPPLPGGARPLKRYTYVQRSAYILNSSGALVSPYGMMWVPDSIVECQTSAGDDTPACDPSAFIRTTSYVYGQAGTPDSLMVKGVLVSANGETLTTCFQYDKFRRLISETKPRAGLSSCP